MRRRNRNDNRHFSQWNPAYAMDCRNFFQSQAPRSGLGKIGHPLLGHLGIAFIVKSRDVSILSDGADEMHNASRPFRLYGSEYGGDINRTFHNQDHATPRSPVE